MTDSEIIVLEKSSLRTFTFLLGVKGQIDHLKVKK